MVISYLKRRVLARFLRDQDGSASIEAVIMMPMVFWVYLAMFTFFQLSLIHISEPTRPY